MEYRSIGKLQVSVVGLGCNNFGRHLDANQTTRVVDAALEHGITLFDTADVYYGVEGASEPLLRRALGSKRDQVVLATKFGMPQGDEGRGGASPRWLRTAVEDSLRRLDTDRIDLYQLHKPDPTVPIEETLETLDELVTAGKVREIGHANFNAQQIKEAEVAAQSAGTVRFVSTQAEWSLVSRSIERDVVPAAQQNRLGLLPFFPLSSGLLTGKYRPDREADPSWRLAKIPDRNRFIDEDKVRTAMALERFAIEAGHTLLELAFSWLAFFQVVSSVIAGATKPEQVAANASAAEWRLTEDERARVDELTSAYR